MMDPLARIEPVARPLLRFVDTALASLGAPPEHPIWALLRQVGVTPADAATHVSMTVPSQLREAGDRLRATMRTYQAVAASPQVTWRGRAGQEYAAQARALDAHLGGELSEGLADAGRYLDEVAEWQERARLDVAGALADVLVSAEALILAQARAGGGAGSGSPVSSTVILAAADVGAHVLGAVAAVIGSGEALLHRWGALADERVPAGAATPTAPSAGRPSGDPSIEVRH